MDNPFDLSGKVVLVTGGSRGLGRAMVLGFAAHGADVIIASRKFDACEAVAAEVRAMGRKALPVAAHVGRWDDCDALVHHVYAQFGRIDVLVNNAGMSPLYGKLSEVTEEMFDKVLAVNLKGPYRLSALIGERMAEADGGSIINVSSVAAANPAPNAEPYGAAKAGLNNLTRSFAFAFGPKVRVNSIMAGPFLTDISKAWDMEAFKQRAATRIALQRGGEADEIVGAALYFASAASSFTTGAILRVDGGT
ncbi:MAG: glucose 1-dehydrogenase [Burkholderiales bacterium]|jgi:NAD(P)-dependent dehydrogenase (short-subunit alcohol dehydrogenase family)